MDAAAPEKPVLTEIPAAIAAVSDYEAFARERISAQAWAYLMGGAGDETTLAENCDAFTRLKLRTRVLQDLSGGDTRLSLLGDALDFPILLAPVAFQKLAHPDGEMATVLAASAMRAAMVVSTQASMTLEEIAAAAAAPLWFQLYLQPDRGFTAELVRRAEAAGYRALVLTADAPVNGLRNREQRAGFRMPPGIEAANLRGNPPRAVTAAEGRILLGTSLLDAAPVWRDLEWLRAQTRLPILLKGIMDSDDARQAVAAGMDGVIVSNHGGRVLDCQPATIAMLPAIAEAVAGRVPLLLDGGIRTGGDIFKALALGAQAVLIGRAFLYGLGAAGAPGVAHVLRILRAELEVTMALTGCRNLAAIDASRVIGRGA